MFPVAGKHGKRRSCPSKERIANEWRRQRLPRRSFGETMRADVWWTQPLLVFLGLSTFIVYSTWAAFQGTHYFFGNYVSPFYSPEIFGRFAAQLVRTETRAGGRSGSYFLPALLVLWAPGGFRLTCYYYRGAYYKAFWADPPACTVGEPRKTYLGERSFPLIMQNVHRYFLYLALAFILILSLSTFGRRSGFADGFGHRRGHDRAGNQCRAAGRLYFWLSFAAASRSADFSINFRKRHRAIAPTPA